MKYAEVAVDAPLGHGRTLSYSIPEGMRVEAGWMVWAPILSRPVQGVVFGLAEQPQVETTKDILATIAPGPLVSPWRLELARWISHWYRSSLFDAVSLMLPPGYKARVRSFLHRELGLEEKLTGLGPEAIQLLAEAVSPRGLPERDLERSLGQEGRRVVPGLLRKGYLRRSWELPHFRTAPRYDCILRLASPTMPDDGLVDRRAPRQRALLEALSAAGASLPLPQANQEYGRSAVDALVKRGLLALEWLKVERRPHMELGAVDDQITSLTEAQDSALGQVMATLDGERDPLRSFLLHGVTGSGKTEVYLRALEDCVKQGKQSIYLVPEIALTPQTVHRLNTRFPHRVAVLHSGLSQGVLFDQWWRIREGGYDVVVGPRGAIFAPVPDPGLIIIDEEHEWTYKQEEADPRYDARQVALQIARLAGSVVVMGSATPDVATYYRAQQGAHRLLELPHRVSSSGPTERGARMPSIQVCDMRQELKEGNTSIFSRPLAGALQECVDRGEQAILFVNRRGSATVVQCRDCGLVMRCQSCAVSLTYHAADRRLLCHHCGRRSRVPNSCGRCRSPRIRYLGIGTQRVTEEVAKLLPGVPIARWDSDVAPSGEAHGSIVREFQGGKTRVLVGTQMVAKGLHVPAVSLVGAVLADVGLTLPDFRAGERAFQLLSQVSGRAGRGAVPGRVVIQTYDPHHYAIASAAAQDYSSFYQQEIGYRREQRNPPFSRLVHMVHQHLNAQVCQQNAERMGRVLRRTVGIMGLADVEVIGPAPAFPERVKGRFRWHVILRGGDLHALLDEVDLPKGWRVDIDPVSVL